MKSFREYYESTLNEGITDKFSKIKNVFAKMKQGVKKGVLVAGMLMSLASQAHASAFDFVKPDLFKAKDKTEKIVEKNKKKTQADVKNLYELCQKFNTEIHSLENEVNYYTDLFYKNVSQLQQYWFRQEADPGDIYETLKDCQKWVKDIKNIFSPQNIEDHMKYGGLEEMSDIEAGIEMCEQGLRDIDYTRGMLRNLVKEVFEPLHIGPTKL